MEIKLRKEIFNVDSNESLVLLSEPSIVQQPNYSDLPSEEDLSDIHNLN